MRIGPFLLEAPLALAPMAGVTDPPFRRLCRSLGAGIAAAEMLTSDVRLWNSDKSRHRLPHASEPEPRVVQIAGGEPEMLAEAARLNEQLGAQIIDINMGCPAKKVCRRAAGSALLRDESLVRRILEAVVRAVRVPVTLKMRTGWDASSRNAVVVARMAEDVGVAALAVHGRTRADMFRGEAEYDTIREVVARVGIPVFANGDVDSPQAAMTVLRTTGAAGVMIGRAAQGRPWIFRQVKTYLTTGVAAEPPSLPELRDIIIRHVEALHACYGEDVGVRIARKHVGWYLQGLTPSRRPPLELMTATSAAQQLDLLEGFLARAAGAMGEAA